MLAEWAKFMKMNVLQDSSEFKDIWILFKWARIHHGHTEIVSEIKSNEEAKEATAKPESQRKPIVTGSFYRMRLATRFSRMYYVMAHLNV